MKSVLEILVEIKNAEIFREQVLEKLRKLWAEKGKGEKCTH